MTSSLVDGVVGKWYITTTNSEFLSIERTLFILRKRKDDILIIVDEEVIEDKGLIFSLEQAKKIFITPLIL